MKARKSTIAVAALLLLSVAALIVFSLPDLSLSSDEKVSGFLKEIIPRTIVGVVMLSLIVYMKYSRLLRPSLRALPKMLLWCIPCLLVAVANFPFTALLSDGGAAIDYPNLIWLFALKCLAVGLMEEAFFRGLLLTVLLERLENRRDGIFLSVIISSAVFGLFHIVNLFYGANPGAVFLQVGYSFLIGAMLAVTLIKTENIWLCILLHALFNFGGNLVPELGSGSFQDMWFWIFTAAAAAIATAHLAYTLYKTKTCYAFKL